MRRERSAGAHLPYSHHFDERTIAFDNGRLMQIVRLRGLLFETADSEDLQYRAELRDALLRSLGTSRYAICHHVVRRAVEPVMTGDFGERFAKGLDSRWRARLETRRLYVNDLYLSVIRRPLQGKVGLVDRLRTGARRRIDRRAQDQAEARQLTAAVEALVSALGAYQPEILSTVEIEGAAYSQPLEFLSELLNGTSRPVLLPHGDIADYLPTRRISFGEDLVELGPNGSEPRRYAAMLSIKDYAPHTSAGMFDELLRLPVAMTVTHSFAFVERTAVLARMNLAIRRMRSAEDEAFSLREELGLAKDEVAAGRASFGEHHATIAISGASPGEVDAAVAEVQAVLSDLGIVAVREEVGLEPAFWAQMPGNFKYVARRALVSTRNFAGFASLHNFASGRPAGNHWGDAVTLLETTAAGPYFFNFHQGDLGNFTVIGPSGSGKTVILNFLLAQAQRFRPRTIFFDKDRGAEIFIRAIGGRYDALRPGEPSGLNPLQIDDTPANRRFLAEWLMLLTGGADEEEQLLIQDAIDASFAQPRAHRRLRYLAELLRGGHRPRAGDLWSRLQSWWGEGDRAWLFDNAEDRIDPEAMTIGFDMTSILNEPALRTPAMFYLFRRVEERLDGQPAIIIVDEGWKALDDEMFVRSLKDWEKTVRKRNGIVGFATQSASDALDSRISSAIIEQSATQVFTVNPRARREDYVDGFGLTEHEFAILRALPDTAHCFLVRQGGESAVVRLDLTGEKDLLTVLSGREATVRALDRLRAEYGDDPDAWMPALLEVA